MTDRTPPKDEGPRWTCPDCGLTWKDGRTSCDHSVDYLESEDVEYPETAPAEPQGEEPRFVGVDWGVGESFIVNAAPPSPPQGQDEAGRFNCAQAIGPLRSCITHDRLLTACPDGVRAEVDRATAALRASRDQGDKEFAELAEKYAALRDMRDGGDLAQAFDAGVLSGKIPLVSMEEAFSEESEGPVPGSCLGATMEPGRGDASPEVSNASISQRDYMERIATLERERDEARAYNREKQGRILEYVARVAALEERLRQKGEKP